MGFVLRCPDCRKKFAWSADKPPRECPLCNAVVASDRPDDDIVMPFVSRKSATVDKVYRDMERGSELRAQAAAEMAGVPAAEMAGMKMTNMRDNARQGEDSAPPMQLSPEMTQFMHQNPNAVGFRGGAQAISFMQGTMSGPAPNVGAHMRTLVQNNHRNMVQQHAVGRDEHGHAVIPSTDVTSERPALETQQPGYRWRG